jgi:predicted deacylase
MAESRFWESLKAGEARRGWWEPGIPDVPPLPILAALGQRDGPTTIITGAVHGDEYEGPAAIHALFNSLDTKQLAGKVIGLPVVNGAAWEARARVAPTDGLDLNRLFPGTPAAADNAAKPSHALAEIVFSTFVRPCDVLVDLHSGGAKLVHLPMIGWYVDGGEAEQLGRTFAQSMFPWRPGTVAGVLSYEAHRAGKVALGAEWGGGARLDPVGAATYAEGLRRILAHLAGESPEPSFFDTRTPLRGSYQQTGEGGLFVASVELGAQVTPDRTLGHLYNPLGERIGEIKAERAGTVAALAHVALLNAGDRMAYIG